MQKKALRRFSVKEREKQCYLIYGNDFYPLLPVLFVVSCVAFLVVYMIPGGPATALLGMEATPEQIAELNTELGFDRPFLVQYVDWFGNVLQGNWRVLFSAPVCAGVNPGIFPPTLSLAILRRSLLLYLQCQWELLQHTKEEPHLI